MATVTDVEVANQSFPNVRQDLNDILEALATNFSADAEPTTTYPNQFWYETDTNLLYIRNEANDAWVTLASINQTSGEWEPRTAVIQAIDSAGLALKTDDGTTRFSISDAGVVSFENYSFPSADGTANQALVTDGAGNLSFADAGGGGDKIEEGNSSVEVVDTGTGSVRVTVDGSETARFEDNGRLGIGTTTPSSMLTIEKTDTADLLLESTLSTNTQLKLSAIAFGTPEINVVSNHGLIFKTNNQQAMLINSSGSLQWGSETSTKQTAEFSNYGSAALDVRRYADTGNCMIFRDDTVVSGTISVSGSSCSYNTSSDYRLKEDWVPMSDSIARVKALNPVNFAWKADGTRVDGFLAHEAQEVVPEAVTGTKDAMTTEDVLDEEGNVVGTKEVPEYQGIDQAKLVPLLTAALQEAIAKIEALEARVSALET